MQVIPVTSLDQPELAPYRTLRRPHEHCQRGELVAEGLTVTLRLLASDLELVSLLLTPELLALHRAAIEGRVGAAPVYVAAQPLLATIVGFRLHQGMMAVARVPTPPSLDVLLAAHPAPLVVALDGLVDPENVGAVVRSAAVLGATALLSGPTSASPWLRRAVRSSMGTVLDLPVVEVADLAGELVHLEREHGLRPVALDPRGATPIDAADLAGAVALVVGREADGLSPEVLAACRERVAIPMIAGADSLNAASAAAIAIWEAMRRR